MLACRCLNVVIETEEEQWQPATAAALGLSREEVEDPFFQQDVRQVGKLININKCHSGLIQTRNVGSWVVHYCINCGVHSHAVHREKGASCVLVDAGLFSGEAVERLRASSKFSKLYKIVIDSDEIVEDDFVVNSYLPGEVENVIKGLKQVAADALKNEALAVEERIQRFSDDQYTKLNKLREKTFREQQILTKIIINNTLDNTKQPASTNIGMSNPQGMPSRLNEPLAAGSFKTTSPSSSAIIGDNFINYAFKMEVKSEEEEEDEEDEEDLEEEFFRSTLNNVVTTTEPSTKLLPLKSQKSYEKAYGDFMKWCVKKEVNDYTENVMLEYFSELAQIYKPSSLWSYYSKIKSTLIYHHDVDISKFRKLLAMLKRKAVGYKPQITKVLSKEQVLKFIKEAPDDFYLMTKVAAILGVVGALSSRELLHLTVDDIQDEGAMLFVNVKEDGRTSVERTFHVLNPKDKSLNFIELYRRYASLRPAHTNHRRFFVYHRNGKCSTQVVGKNTLGKIAATIASYLKLPDPKSYTGRCLRRSAATLY